MLSFASRMMSARVLHLGRQGVCSTSISLRPLSFPSVSGRHLDTTSTGTLSASSSPLSSLSNQLSLIVNDYLTSISIWWIKRTFQPSLLRKKRKHGYLKRSESPGGRKILKRRKAKGRARLFGA